MKSRYTTALLLLVGGACSGQDPEPGAETPPSSTSAETSPTVAPTSSVAPTPGGGPSSGGGTGEGTGGGVAPPTGPTDPASPATTSSTAGPNQSGQPSTPAGSEGPGQETGDSEPGGDTTTPSGGTPTGPSDDSDVVDTGADATFSFFVTSYHHMALLAGKEEGFGGDLRYNGAATGLEGADAICQEIARRVGFGHRTWKAYLSTSTVNAIDRIGAGPWFDFVGAKVADSPQDLIAGGNRQPGGCCPDGTYDEMGLYHDGATDQNNDGIDDDDHDTMTATNADGTYAGFSCDDWTSTTASPPASGGGAGGGFGGGGGGASRGGIMMGHSWPARSGEHWATSHAGHACAAGTNFIQNGGGDSSTVGGGGGYGGIYCFALPE